MRLYRRYSESGSNLNAIPRIGTYARNVHNEVNLVYRTRRSPSSL